MLGLEETFAGEGSRSDSTGDTNSPKGKMMLVGGFVTSGAVVSLKTNIGLCISLVCSVIYSSVITKQDYVLGPMMGTEGQK